MADVTPTNGDPFAGMFADIGELEDQEVDEAGKRRSRRIDYSPYKAKLSQIPLGKVKTIGVPTGTLFEDGNPKTNKNNKGRGDYELQQERNFINAAAEMGIGLRVGHFHWNDGTSFGVPGPATALRLEPYEKEKLPQDLIDYRLLGLHAGTARKDALVDILGLDFDALGPDGKPLLDRDKEWTAMNKLDNLPELTKDAAKKDLLDKARKLTAQFNEETAKRRKAREAEQAAAAKAEANGATKAAAPAAPAATK